MSTYSKIVVDFTSCVPREWNIILATCVCALVSASFIFLLGLIIILILEMLNIFNLHELPLLVGNTSDILMLFIMVLYLLYQGAKVNLKYYEHI